MSPQLVGGWGQAERLAAGAGGGCGPQPQAPTGSSRPPAPSSQLWAGVPVSGIRKVQPSAVSAQDPRSGSTGARLQRRPAEQPRSFSGSLQAQTASLPCSRFAVSASQLLYQTVSSWWRPQTVVKAEGTKCPVFSGTAGSRVPRAFAVVGCLSEPPVCVLHPGRRSPIPGS